MQATALAHAPRKATLPLYDRTVADQVSRNEAALRALESRREDIQRLEFFVAALASRGWKVRASISTHPLGDDSAMCRLHVWLAATGTVQLSDVLMWLGEKGITVTRHSECDTDATRSYRVTIDDTEVHLVTQIEASPAPAPRAA